MSELSHDEVDQHRRIACPLLVLWGEQGAVAGRYDALAIWGARGERVTGRQMPGGHSFQETHPAETASELRAFLRA